MSRARIAWLLVLVGTIINSGAGIGYLIAGEWRKGVYWIAAAVIGGTFL